MGGWLEMEGREERLGSSGCCRMCMTTWNKESFKLPSYLPFFPLVMSGKHRGRPCDEEVAAIGLSVLRLESLCTSTIAGLRTPSNVFTVVRRTATSISCPQLCRSTRLGRRVVLFLERGKVDRRWPVGNRGLRGTVGIQRLLPHVYDYLE
ncbi:hypothetical protein NDU88_002791 [Pleurodeles waltl]|uniref:Uncharacterized protein n=1 Tax=Pleurodeles waltl TaxID=8319 RepID=A0AAV7LGW8_PLEWA|nr:hypothetical protein NDU88_002791 [Pleurodeles waltl]